MYNMHSLLLDFIFFKKKSAYYTQIIMVIDLGW